MSEKTIFEPIRWTCMEPQVRLLNYIEITKIQCSRLQTAIHKLKGVFPLSSDFMDIAQDIEYAYLDMFATRFGKLQDVIGSKIFPIILDLKGENDVAFIDKINKLEKLTLLL